MLKHLPCPAHNGEKTWCNEDIQKEDPLLPYKIANSPKDCTCPECMAQYKLFRKHTTQFRKYLRGDRS